MLGAFLKKLSVNIPIHKRHHWNDEHRIFTSPNYIYFVLNVDRFALFNIFHLEVKHFEMMKGDVDSHQTNSPEQQQQIAIPAVSSTDAEMIPTTQQVSKK